MKLHSVLCLHTSGKGLVLWQKAQKSALCLRHNLLRPLVARKKMKPFPFKLAGSQGCFLCCCERLHVGKMSYICQTTQCAWITFPRAFCFLVIESWAEMITTSSRKGRNSKTYSVAAQPIAFKPCVETQPPMLLFPWNVSGFTNMSHVTRPEVGPGGGCVICMSSVSADP